MGNFRRIYRTDLTDNQIKAFWHQVMESGRDRSILFDMPNVDEETFCKWFRQDNVAPWVIMHGSDVCGMFYLTDKAGKTAYCHFLTLPMGTKRVARLPMAFAAGLYAVSNCLWERNASGGFLVDTLIGVTPSFNRPALRFIQRLGAQFVAEVPGACFFCDTGENVPGVVTTLTRDSVPESARKL